MADDRFVDIDEIMYDDMDGSVAVEKIIREKPVSQKKTSQEPTPKEEIKVKEGKISVEEKAPVKEEKPALKVVPVAKKVPQKKPMAKKAVKNAPEKQAKPKKKSQKKDSSNGWLLIVLSAIVVVAIVFALFLIFKEVSPGGETSKVAAVVNGEPIYNAELEQRFGLLSTTSAPSITMEETLNAMIEERLLVQEAKKNDLSASDAEVDALLGQIMISNGITLEELKVDLAERGSSYEELYSFYRNSLTVNKLVNQTILSNTTVNEEELRSFYETNKEFLITPETVTVRHILVMYGEGPDTETFEKAEEISEMIEEDKSNFCDLVTEYSEDSGSIMTCGEYTVAETDPFVPEFIEAGFSMEIGEVRIVKTQFGYHIMYKTDESPEEIPSFEEVSLELRDIVLQEKHIDAYQDMISSLRMSAIIEIYSETPSSEEVKQPLIPVEAPSQNGESPVKETLTTEESKKLNLAKCLSDKGAQLFTVYWCPHCNDQKDMFGSHISYIDVLECDADGENPRVAECQAASITNIPTWIINGQKYVGAQSLNKLAELSGCIY